MARTIVVAGCAVQLGGSAAAERATDAAPTAASDAAAANEAQRVRPRFVTLRYLPADAVTGRWDYRTSQAIIAFQAWEALTRDGVAGRLARAALLSASGARSSHVRPRGRPSRCKGVTLLVDNSLSAPSLLQRETGIPTPTGVFRVFRKGRNSWWSPIAFGRRTRATSTAGSRFMPRSPAPDPPPAASPLRKRVYAFAKLGTRVVVC